MGNKSAKPAPSEPWDDVLFVRSVPLIDQDFARWLARDVERIHRFVPRKPCAIKPPDHYVEYMRMNGWLDIDLNDPDLAHLFK